jgi:GntR family transcriptional regulator
LGAGALSWSPGLLVLSRHWRAAVSDSDNADKMTVRNDSPPGLARTAALQADLPRLATRRLAERAKEALVRSIRQGNFADGRVPSEENLAAQLGVSRSTVREALRSMEEDGLVRRQHGIGTRVNDHLLGATSINRIDGFYDLIRQAGYEPTIAWTATLADHASTEVGERLGRDGGVPVVLVERVFLADRQPVIHLIEHLAADAIAAPFEAADEIPESIFALADRFCRTPIDHTVVEIIPTVADEAARQHLPLAKGEPLLRLVETHYSRQGEPFIVSVINVRELLRITVVRKRM